MLGVYKRLQFRCSRTFLLSELFRQALNRAALGVSLSGRLGGLVFDMLVVNRSGLAVQFSLQNERKVRNMNNLLKRLWSEEEGQDLTEYALLLALIALGAIGAMKTIASTINGVFQNAASNLSGATTGGS